MRHGNAPGLPSLGPLSSLIAAWRKLYLNETIGVADGLVFCYQPVPANRFTELNRLGQSMVAAPSDLSWNLGR